MIAWSKPIVSANALDANFSLRDRMYRVLRRWHGRNTHQRFALDALPLVQTPAGHRLVALLLRHYDRYLTGAVDPDLRFRDFQNHVIHVCQGYWGGAPRIAHRWYDRLLRHLNEGRYGEAAHAAGVLSHYFVDPLQPLHTMQCPRGRVIHRPLEWSISKTYDEILRRWIEDDLRIVVQLSDRPGWLGDAILHNARYSHGQYNRLVQEYDIDSAFERPLNGLNEIARSTLAGLFGLSITGWARVLERAAFDAEALQRKPLPAPSLIPSYLTATIRIPIEKWSQRVESKIQRAQIKRLIREYHRHGKLNRHLPAEVDIMDRVAEVYADEQRYMKQRQERIRDAAANHESVETIPFSVADTVKKTPGQRVA